MENVTVFAVLAFLAYSIKESRPPPPAKPVTLNADDEVDVTRWRHDGTQAADYGSWDGNKAHQKQAAVLELREVLAF